MSAEQLKQFITANTKQLCEIYVKERMDRGVGLLMIYYESEDGQVKVCYLEMNQLPESLASDLEERYAKNSSDIVYFFLNHGEESSLIEFDIRN